jgi:hypothetical protein
MTCKLDARKLSCPQTLVQFRERQSMKIRHANAADNGWRMADSSEEEAERASFWLSAIRHPPSASPYSITLGTR